MYVTVVHLLFQHEACRVYVTFLHMPGAYIFSALLSWYIHRSEQVENLKGWPLSPGYAITHLSGLHSPSLFRCRIPTYWVFRVLLQLA